MQLALSTILESIFLCHGVSGGPRRGRSTYLIAKMFEST